MKKRIKIYFTDFWPGFNIEDNFFINLIKNEYDVQLDRNNPDFIFYSNFGTDYTKYNCTRIYYTGENTRPDYSECDWAFTFDFSDDYRNYRFPLYGIFADMEEMTKPKDAEKLLSEKKEFCNFIYSNPGPKKRKEIFFKLSKYKQVHSVGRYLNNLGYSLPGFVQEKRDFISKYKFTFAFENSSYSGYTTEKILDPLLCGSIPLYWGNKDVAKDFNPKSFLNYHDYENDQMFIEKIIELDTNKTKYLEMISEPAFHNNIINSYVNKSNLLERIKFIFSQDIIPIAQKSPVFSKSKVKSGYYILKAKLNYEKSVLKKRIKVIAINNFLVQRIEKFYLSR